jgi:hypothetical protein
MSANCTSSLPKSENTCPEKTSRKLVIRGLASFEPATLLMRRMIARLGVASLPLLDSA